MENNQAQDDFLTGANAIFIAELQRRWRSDSSKVSVEWATWFERLDRIEGGGDLEDLDIDLDWGENPSQIIGVEDKAEAQTVRGVERFDASRIRHATLDSIRAIMLIRAYRMLGHLMAKLDPLEMSNHKSHPELDPATYGFTEADMDRPVFINYVLGLEVATLREILSILKETYCNTVGVEFMHIQNSAHKSWIQARMEGGRNHTDFTKRGKVAIYERLVSAENFEQYLHKKYVGTKRFGLDGGESVIPGIEQILKRGSQLGLEEVVVGMAHRGRLNVLYNILSKPFRAIISEFLGNPANPEDAGGSGDVKYHMGNSADRDFDGQQVHLTLNANPSHLEIVNPVVIGRSRAKQNQRQDRERTSVLSLLIHGDAAFAGQGIVAETFAFSALIGYRTGGTIHIVINNQIGFTTDPAYSRSSPYPTAVAKKVMAPIFHVNCDDVESVVHACRLAIEFRQKFKSDVVLDLICYRRFGHNEGDEPSFTQPLMYQKIKNHPTTRKIYGDKLVAEGTMTAEEAQAVIDKNTAYLDEEFTAGTSYRPDKADWLEGQWAGFRQGDDENVQGVVKASDEHIKIVAKAMTTVPDHLTIHRKLSNIIEGRKKALDEGSNIDWSVAEHLAFGTLLLEGKDVRLSGQDSRRGTFSQRHAHFVDQNTGERYVPLNHLHAEQAMFEVIDSPLSEASVLGFEYGFSQAEPNTLVMWEAQFGDFANGAQVIVDQFISSGEAKWLRMSGLVMLLPHGHEGQGPEHSSARLERYLQLCAENNMQVVNCSTPANYFHVLRRQVNRDFRKPLIVMTPKSLLRHKLCVSTMEDLTDVECFRPVLAEKDAKISKKAKRIVLCSGKVYYDLLTQRMEAGIDDVSIVRLEQLYPFPDDELKEILSANPDAEVIWCQEEPHNMGAWFFISPLIEEVMGEAKCKYSRPRYIGRPAAASPATGSLKRHLQEQGDLVNAALNLDMKE